MTATTQTQSTETSSYLEGWELQAFVPPGYTSADTRTGGLGSTIIGPTTRELILAAAAAKGILRPPVRAGRMEMHPYTMEVASGAEDQVSRDRE